MPRSPRAATAVDTNVVIRLLTGDNPGQAAKARSLFENGAIWLAKTVVLESHWVLRRLYGFERSRVAETLLRLVALPNVRCEDEAAVVTALEWATERLDFADALHLASAGPASTFATFNADLVNRAGTIAKGVIAKAL
jgi:predicted nucleic-acid-binding protein